MKEDEQFQAWNYLDNEKSRCESSQASGDVDGENIS